MPGRPFQKGKSGIPVDARKRCASSASSPARMRRRPSKNLRDLATKARERNGSIAAIRELLDRGVGKSAQFVTDDETDASPNTLKIVFVKLPHRELPPLSSS